ncbi:MAG: alpha-isopropylmalate synthase regulatory domain-containing protein [Alistipes indistinctus]
MGGSERTATCTGNGPVDAAVKAIKTLINETVQITEFLIQAMNKGSDDVGRVHVQVRCNGQIASSTVFRPIPMSVKAAVEAFVDALNLLEVRPEKAE